MEKKLEIEGKEYTIKEMKYKDIVELSDIPQKEMAKQLLILATGLSEEEYNDLSIKTGITLQREINEVNGLVDFQNLQNE